MTILTILFIDLRWIPDELSVPDAVVATIAALIGLSAVVKAVFEIRTKGWQPFKERWITPWRAKRKEINELGAKLETGYAELKALIIERDQVLRSSMAEHDKAKDEKLDRIEAQLSTNGGSTVKDVLIDVSKKVTAVIGEVKEVKSKVDYIQARSANQVEVAAGPEFELDATGDMTVTNCAFRELVNADDQELLYRKFLSRIQVDDRARLIREIAEARENKMPFDSIVRFRIGANEFQPVRLQANADVRSGGELMGFFGTASRVNADGECDPVPTDCPRR